MADRNLMGASSEENSTVSLAGFEVGHGSVKIVVSERKICGV